MSHSSFPPRADYAVTPKGLHWLMALLIMLDLIVARRFGTPLTDLDRFGSRSDHAAIGITIAVLLVLRLYFRWRYGVPALPANMPDWQKQLAQAAHWALYGLIALLIVSGVIAASAANSVIEPFGLFAINDGIEGNFVGLRQVHQWVIWAISTLIVAHIAAALYHWLWLRDTITQRMLRFWRSEE